MSAKHSRAHNPSPCIGLALGSGASRGWAHIGIIQELAALGVEPDIVCGCSIGSIVGAAYVSGKLDTLHQWVCAFSKRDIIRFFELDFSFNGFIDAEHMHAFLHEYVCDEEQLIEKFDKTFATVSTELKSGREIWFDHGPAIDAVRASISLPGLFPPMLHDGRWLVDGGLVNPVPVSVCRALGAEIVIAVNLNGDIVGKHFIQKSEPPGHRFNNEMINQIAENIKAYSESLFTNNHDAKTIEPPNIFDAIAGSWNITQDRITRSRMAGDPPDVMLVPKLSHIGLLEFYRADQAIEEGRNCVRRMESELRHSLNLDH